MMTQVEAISRQLGIHSLLEKYPYEISGGQKQRVAVAREWEAEMKLYKTPLFFLLFCLLTLTLLSGCSSDPQAAGQSIDSPEASSPEQSVEEVQPEEDPAQAEVLDPETNDEGGEGAVPTVPQPPSTSTVQTDEPVQPGNETAPDMEPAPPEPETPGGAAEPPEPAPGNSAVDNTGSEEEITEMKMTVQVGESTFTATLEDNAAVDALVEMMENGPVTVQMSDYAGFEKVGALGISLPTNNSQTTTQAGDIVLYQGNQIVLFYGSNSWSYTRLGKIDDLTGWSEALGSGDVLVTFSLGG